MTVMEVRYGVPRRGVAGFAEAWIALGGTVGYVDDGTLIDAVRAFSGGAAIVAGPQTRFDGLVEAERWPACGIRTTAGTDVAVVQATAAVAQTGSVVVDSDANGGRALSLLAPRAIFVVDTATIVDTPADVLRSRHRWWPKGPPSQIVMITGPSRSADIEMTLTVGVHGPGIVHALIVGA